MPSGAAPRESPPVPLLPHCYGDSRLPGACAFKGFGAPLETGFRRSLVPQFTRIPSSFPDFSEQGGTSSAPRIGGGNQQQEGFPGTPRAVKPELPPPLPPPRVTGDCI
ncbi:uncharacterized protein LOC144308893 isoform X2 [Canis aureus]